MTEIDFGIGFLGCGAMGKAITAGFFNSGIVTKDKISVSSLKGDGAEEYCEEVGISYFDSKFDVLERSRIIIFCVKPNVMKKICEEIRPQIKPEYHIFVSIAAGVTTKQIEESLGSDAHVVRIMPNLCAQVFCATSSVSGGSSATAEDSELVAKLFQSVGEAFIMEEYLVDTHTALSGSGPAFVFTFIEALAAGGVTKGMHPDMARKIAINTVLGAATFLQKTGHHPAVARDFVTSAGGTTIYGLNALEEGNFRSTVTGAVKAATDRAKELGK